MLKTLKKHKVIVIIIIIIFILVATYFIWAAITKSWTLGLISDYEVNVGKIGRVMPCPGKNVLPNTFPASNCIVKREDAAEICNSMSNCFGYGTNTNAVHNTTFPNAAQLTDGHLEDNPEWTTYVKKI